MTDTQVLWSSKFYLFICWFPDTTCMFKRCLRGVIKMSFRRVLSGFYVDVAMETFVQNS